MIHMESKFLKTPKYCMLKFMWLIRAFWIAYKLLIFGNPSYIEFPQNLTGIIWWLYASPNKTCQVFIQKYFDTNNILQNAHAPILQNLYHVDTSGPIMNRCYKWVTYWHITQLHMSIVQGLMFI